MPKIDIKSFVFFAIIIAVFYYTYFIFQNLTHSIPPPGDSWDYHIPIANGLLNGAFLNNDYFKMPQWYYPASSEVIHALFIYLHIPLTLSNLFATIILAFCCYKLARTFKTTREISLLYSLSFVTLNTLLRWLNQVSVDAWIAVFFVLSIILLENPRPTKSYFLKLGVCVGMLIGTKYTALPLLLPLIFFYIIPVIKKINPTRIFLFLIMITVFGFVWYIRNYTLTGNPFYPLPIFGFGGKNLFNGMLVWNIGLQHPIQMINAAFGEYKIWIFTIPVAIVFLLKPQIFKLKKTTPEILLVKKIFAIGLILFLVFLFFPTSHQEWIMVSSFRYSYPAFILLILGVFKLAVLIKKEHLIGFIALCAMLGVFQIDYYPKLLLIQIPLSAFAIIFVNKFLSSNQK